MGTDDGASGCPWPRDCCHFSGEITALRERVAEAERLLRHAQSGFDVIACKNGEPRWDLSERIEKWLAGNKTAASNEVPK